MIINKSLLFLLSALFFWSGCSAKTETTLPTDEIQNTIFFNNKTPGGLGGKIIKVTNLNSSGEGSLRAALEEEEPRIVVFEVGGIIDLEMDKLSIKNPYVTIAGQTAPSPGITIIRGGIYISTHDVVIRHICIRPGDANQATKSGWEPDGISAYGENVHHVWIDHCSVSWAVDENVSASGPRILGQYHTSNHITFSNNIIAEALHESSHSEGPHSKGTLIHDNCTEIAIIGNLYAHNVDRNPYFKANTKGVIVNNLIYNPSSSAIRLNFNESDWEVTDIKPEKPMVTIVGNVYYGGVDSDKILSMIKNQGKVYLKNNMAFDSQMKELPQTSNDIIILEQMPCWPEGLKAMTAREAEAYVVKNAGARPADRDPIDQRIVRDFKNKEGMIIDSQQEVGGYPDYDSSFRKLDVPDENIEDWLKAYDESVEMNKQ